MSKKECILWEPYKGATDAFNVGNNISKNQASAIPSKDNQQLIRYKVDTDLRLFNAQRPGYTFDEYDHKLIEKLSDSPLANAKMITTKASMKNDEKLGTTFDKEQKRIPFVDARFYTDVHFLKLANELKAKCSLDSASWPCNDSARSAGPISPLGIHGAVKPINVVGPMIENQLVKVKNQTETGNSTQGGQQQSDPIQSSSSQQLPSVDIGSLKIWKAKCFQYEAHIDYLNNQINGLNEQLQIQTQVNAELKTLLVASVGEDMQYKLERAVNDKQRLELKLISNNKSVDTMAEEIEQISIQCDMWRSKFLASKLMLDELSVWKSFLLLLNKENEAVLTNVLNDNRLVNEKLLQANDLLGKLTTNARESSTQQSQVRSLLNLNNIQLSNSILNKLSTITSTSKPTNADKLKHTSTKDHRYKTNNEIVAEQLLEQFEWLNLVMQSQMTLKNDMNMAHKSNHNDEQVINSFDKLVKLIDKIKLKRQTTHSRLFQAPCCSQSHDLLNCCKECTGQVQIV